MKTVRDPLHRKCHLPLTDAEERSIQMGVRTLAALREYMWGKFGGRNKELQAVLHHARQEPTPLRGPAASPWLSRQKV